MKKGTDIKGTEQSPGVNPCMCSKLIFDTSGYEPMSETAAFSVRGAEIRYPYTDTQTSPAIPPLNKHSKWM